MDHTVTEMGERRLDLELDPIRVELVLRDEAVLPGLEVRSYAGESPAQIKWDEKVRYRTRRGR